MAENGYNPRGGLEQQLDELPLHKPPSGFADVVMVKVGEIEASQTVYAGSSASLLQRASALLHGLLNKRLYSLATLAVVIVVVGAFLHSTRSEVPQFSYGYSDTDSSIDVSTTVIADGKTSIDLLEGLGVLTLRSDSVIQLQKDGVYLEAGRVFFDMELNGREFRVYTKYGEVLVTGTEFFVEVLDSAVVVTVVEGVVTFTRDTAEKKVPEGKQLEVTREGVIVTRQDVDVQESAEPDSGKPDKVESGTTKPVSERKDFHGYTDQNHGSSGFKLESVSQDNTDDGISVNIGSSDNLEKIFDE